MSIDRRVLVFPNRSGNALVGTIHRPTATMPNLPMIVLLSPGIKMRVGPHRLYNRMTATFNELGFTVFKFDFSGLGDSEGEIQRDFLHEVYNMTESGIFVNDSADALDYLADTYGTTSFIVGGLCGGAITALLLAQQDARVCALLSLAMTVTLSSGPENHSKHAGANELEALRKGYIRRLSDPKSWLRLLTLKSDFRALSRSMMQVVFSKHSSRSGAPTEKKYNAPLTNANPLFPSALFSVLESGRKVLFIYSKADRTYWDFQEKFMDLYRDRIEELRQSYELHLIDAANHVLSFREWENQVHGIAAKWLTDNFLSTILPAHSLHRPQ